MRVIMPWMFLIAVASCATSEAKGAGDVAVVLASVTLADQCPSSAPPAAGPTGFAKPPGAPAQSRSCVKGSICGGPRQHCEQTSMQLTLTPAFDLKSSVKIKRVELLDKRGQVVQTLTASAPMQWSVASAAYLAWDEKIGKDPVRASYHLSAPDWNKLTNGRMNAPGHTFQLRVIVTVGGADRTVEKTAVVPARVAPMVVT